MAVEWQLPPHCGNLGFHLNELLFRLIIVSLNVSYAGEGRASATFIIQIRPTEMRCIRNALQQIFSHAGRKFVGGRGHPR